MKRVLVLVFLLSFSTAAFSLDADHRVRGALYMGPYFASGSSLDTGFNIGLEGDFAFNDNLFAGVSFDFIFLTSPDYRLRRAGTWEWTDEFNTALFNVVVGGQAYIANKLQFYASIKGGLAILDDSDDSNSNNNNNNNSSDSDDWAATAETGFRYYLSEVVDIGAFGKYSIVGDFGYLPSALDVSGFSIGVACGLNF
jgi:hypothetical protein